MEDRPDIVELHEEVFKGLLPDHGQWRRINVTIDGASFTPPRPERAVPKMDALIKEYDQRELSERMCSRWGRGCIAIRIDPPIQ